MQLPSVHPLANVFKARCLNWMHVYLKEVAYASLESFLFFLSLSLDLLGSETASIIKLVPCSDNINHEAIVMPLVMFMVTAARDPECSNCQCTVGSQGV